MQAVLEIMFEIKSLILARRTNSWGESDCGMKRMEDAMDRQFLEQGETPKQLKTSERLLVADICHMILIINYLRAILQLLLELNVGIFYK